MLRLALFAVSITLCSTTVVTGSALARTGRHRASVTQHGAVGGGSFLTRVRRAKAAVLNLAPRLSMKLESSRLAFKARRGKLRQSQYVVGKTHVFRSANGGTRRVTNSWSVSNRRLLPEIVAREDRATNGQVIGSGAIYLGNARRLGSGLSRRLQAIERDPVFRAAMGGDRAAAASWNARVKAAEAQRRANPEGEPRPARFVDGQGRALVVPELKAAPLFGGGAK